MTRHSKSISDILGREPVHPFPARMAATVALNAVSHARTPLRILDPMMGSGTVLALARSKGHYATGVDIDPLAVLIGRVWTTPVDKNAVRKKAIEVLEVAKKRYGGRKQSEAYPANADPETKQFIRFWFDPVARRQLSVLADQIYSCRNTATRNLLWCAFSRLIISKQAGASLALDLSHSRPHKSFSVAPRKPFTSFLSAIDLVLQNCISKHDKQRGPATKIYLGDARRLQRRSNSIDLVLTSPPYLNAIDYMRCSKFSLVWMRHAAVTIRTIRSRSIGTEVGLYSSNKNDRATKFLKALRINSRLSSRHKAVLSRFIEDMGAVISEASRVLVPGGTAIFVVGENALAGTYIRNSKIIHKLAIEAGLTYVSQSKRTIPPNRRYLPPPTTKKGTINVRMRQEVVIKFLKPKILRS